jgi:hypothetical protein
MQQSVMSYTRTMIDTAPFDPSFRPKENGKTACEDTAPSICFLQKNSHLRGFLSYERPVAPLWELERKAH